MEGKIRQKATDLEKRERKIVDLEEELSKKIGEVSRALTGKEEEIINIKRRFKEERVQLDADKKRLKQEVNEY
jgi:predicted  nucleic acid-binding Zn-ribbon protein